MKNKDLVSIADYSGDQILEILDLSSEMKANPAKFLRAMENRTLAMIFMKPSTRTRVSFETGMTQMSGHAIYLSSNDIQIGRGESIADTARVLSRYADCIMARVFSHSDVENLAKYASVPVINGLSDFSHPCQALADFLTIREKKRGFKGLKLAFLGDGNNVAHSLIFISAKLGVDFSIACPEGYEPSKIVIEKASSDAKQTGSRITITHDPYEAARNSDIIYADVWVSMGQEKEKEEKARIFKPYQVNMDIFSIADPEAIFMHCLPAHRGEEVTDEVCDHPRSVIFDEAENRLHAQKALMVLLIKT
jgi:ornithine carbamoyltransferase